MRVQIADAGFLRYVFRITAIQNPVGTPIDLNYAVGLSALAAELTETVESNWQGYEAWTTSEEGLLSSPRIREIGEQANRLGGLNAMFTVAEAALKECGGCYRNQACMAASSELNYVWSGIGDWQA